MIFAHSFVIDYKLQLSKVNWRLHAWTLIVVQRPSARHVELME